MKHLIVLLLSSISLCSLKAQTSVNGGGGNATGSAGNVSYTIGQTFYTTQSTSAASSTQGVQQPYEISITSGLKETLITLNLSVYPNPTSGKILIKDNDCTKASDKIRTEIRRDDIGFIYQFHHLLPEFSALENVLIPQLIAKKTKWC